MDTPSPKHRRNRSLRATRPRSSTKGPLDMPDEYAPLSRISSKGGIILMTDRTVESPKQSGDPPKTRTSHSASQSTSSTRGSVPSTPTLSVDKSFSFLLRRDIYHPLSQLEVPPAFRSEFRALPPNASLHSALLILDDLLSEGHFLLAAHFSAAILTSPIISSNDHSSIFSLFYTRLACLELCGNTLLAAQEVKALEDLSSAFYYLDSDTGSRSQHVVPWPLRVLAVRLQSIGFGDARRGITGLYELGLEARTQILRPEIGHEEKNMWKERLGDLGIRAVNTLIEMGDLEAARRSLASMKVPQANGLEIARMVLLHLRIGDIEAARVLLESSPNVSGGILGPLLGMAEGRFTDAVTEWRNLREHQVITEDETLVAQNLAVCLLYVGKLNEVTPYIVFFVWADSLIVKSQGKYSSLSSEATNLFRASRLTSQQSTNFARRIHKISNSI
ncbi:hypothetical protein DIZ76_017412 [Coccidioides immitis]|nr:hypothetical protein DIZ76_017412 [Coccidioides immitis]